MKYAYFFFLVVILFQGAFAEGTDDLLQYDDGLAGWFSFEGEYRGTWFNLDDFYLDSDASGFIVNYAEVWFFHVMSNPWDVSDYIGQITDGTPDSPGTVFFNEFKTAQNLSPNYFVPTVPCTTSTNFTVTAITLSGSGAPSMASDISPSPDPRSFYVDSGILTFWMEDYLIRVNGYPTPPLNLSRTTWASLKAIF